MTPDLRWSSTHGRGGPSSSHALILASRRDPRILADASAVLTHAGHGTVLKSLAAAVLLVCIPMGRDQKDNTARVLRLGAGVRLNQRSTPGRIAAPVSEVLHNPEYAAAAASFAEVLAREAASTPSAADEAEALLQLAAAADPGRGDPAR